MRTISQVAKAMKSVLTREASKAGRASGFVQRRSKLSASKWVQTLCFGFLANPQASLSELSETATFCQCNISAQGLDERFSWRAVECLRLVLKAAMKVLISTGSHNASLLERFSEVRVTDTTAIPLPDSLSSQFRGHDNCHKQRKGAMKASLGWELREGNLVGPFLADGRRDDRKIEQQEHPPIRKGGLDLCDLGYYSIPRLRKLAKDGIYFISRLQYHTSVFDCQGKRYRLIELVERLGRRSGRVDLMVSIGSLEHFPCRLVARRVSPEVAAERRRRLKLHRHGKIASAERLRLAAWTLYVTNVPDEMLSVDEVMRMGRARWQIELLFKLWKGHGRIDEWRSRKPERILCEIYAKLLAMIVSHWIMLAGAWCNRDRSFTKAVRLIGKYGLWLCNALHHSQLEEWLERLGRLIQKKCRTNKRRKHPAAFQLLAEDYSP